MKISFTWKESFGELMPVCNVDLFNKDDINLLACILMDDGGLPYIQTVSWIEEGISDTDSVIKGITESKDWVRETWGVNLRRDNAKIYSLYDENYFDVIDINLFRRVLVEWKDFIQSEPKQNIKRVIEIQKPSSGKP